MRCSTTPTTCRVSTLRLRLWRGLTTGLLLSFVPACPGSSAAKRINAICAVRDCKTGELIDDGCASDGKCKSCVNDCGGRVAPRNGPAAAPFPLR